MLLLACRQASAQLALRLNKPVEAHNQVNKTVRKGLGRCVQIHGQGRCGRGGSVAMEDCGCIAGHSWKVGATSQVVWFGQLADAPGVSSRGEADGCVGAGTRLNATVAQGCLGLRARSAGSHSRSSSLCRWSLLGLCLAPG